VNVYPFIEAENAASSSNVKRACILPSHLLRPPRRRAFPPCTAGRGFRAEPGRRHRADRGMASGRCRNAVSQADELRQVFGAQAPRRGSQERTRPGRQGSRRWPNPRRTNRLEFFDDVRGRVPVLALGDEDVWRVADQWTELVHGDLERARAWWAAGFSPLDQSVTELIQEGVQPEDLAVRVDGRTLLEHFRSGEFDKSGRWCAHQASRAGCSGAEARHHKALSSTVRVSNW
jgi:hypothetical protein